MNQLPTSVFHLMSGGTGKCNEDIRFNRNHKDTEFGIRPVKFVVVQLYSGAAVVSIQLLIIFWLTPPFLRHFAPT